MWWWWGLLGYALGQEQGRQDGQQEGLREAKRRIDANDDGPPRIHRATEQPPPPPPPKRSDWIKAAILSVLIFGVALTIDGATFQKGGNITVSPSDPGIVGFVGLLLTLLRWGLYLASLVPLSLTLRQYLDSQPSDEPTGRFTFKETDQ